MEIARLALAGGTVALCPMPGRGGDLAADVKALGALAPALVISLTTAEEMAAGGAGGLEAALGARGIGWVHLPVDDYATPEGAAAARWPGVAAQVRAVLAAGGTVLAHCRGGCGRSGMVVLRLMVEAGEDPQAALARLRAVRPCAVETAAQYAWAVSPASPAA